LGDIVLSYIIWVIIYLIFAVIFAQGFKSVNRDMKNASALTILLEFFTALFALILSPLFAFRFPSSFTVYIIVGIVTIIYAITDRLNIEARYGLDPSTFSMLKQLSTVFLVIFGFVFLKESFILKKIIGIVLILVSNVLLSVNKSGKIQLNKYFIMSFISNFLFAIAMFINVNIAQNFNICIYTVFTVLVPSIIIKIFSKLSIKDLKKEFNLYNKRKFLLVSFSWCVMLISSVKAYEQGNVSVVAPLLTLTSILNSIYEFFEDKNKKMLLYKLFISMLIILGVILIKI
jgi:bacterial/archaeal transporter family protein